MAPPYVLLLLRSEGTDSFVIVDPQEGGKRVFGASTYDEARIWLLEDEYERASERLEVQG